jgi:hypothetical protein
MEAVSTSEMLENFYQTTWRCYPEYSHLLLIVVMHRLKFYGLVDKVLLMGPHGVITQKKNNLVFTALRTSNFPG